MPSINDRGSDVNHIIVAGTGGLATAIMDGLKSAGVQIVQLVDDDVADTPVDLAEAGIARASAVLCAGDDDALNLEIALLAREANPKVRVVARVANDVLRGALGDDDEHAVIFDVAELSSSSIVEACLAQPTHSFTAAGVHFTVSGAEASRAATLRELYGDLAPVAVIRGHNSAKPGTAEVCPGRDLRVQPGDWVAVLDATGGVAPQTLSGPPSKSRQRRIVLHRMFDALRAMQEDLNPAFYPVLAGLLTLVTASTVLLRLSYQAPPKMTWVNALYFTAETITTTGYGDFSFVNQPAWLTVFSTLLMFSGTATTALVIAFVADVLLSRRFMFAAGQPRVRHLRNHVVVVGLSALGFRVVNDLSDAGHDVAVIEVDEDNRYLSAVRELDVPVIYGDATLRQTLKSARVESARAVAVMTRIEVINIEVGIVLAQMLGRRLSPEVTRPDVPLVLRVYDQALGAAVAKRFGFINVRSTVELAAPWFISAAIGLDVLGSFSVGHSSFVIGAMGVADGSELDGLQMAQLSTQTRVIAITRPDAAVQLHPRHNARLHGGDTVYLVGPYRELLETLRRGHAAQGSR